MKDYYKILGVPRNATPEQIKSAYRAMARKSHPDRGGDEEAFKEVNEAYSVLSDPEKKKEYDTPEFTKRKLNPNSWDETFGDFFRNMRRNMSQSRVPTDKDIKFNLGVNLEQIKRGATQKINYKRTVSCDTCKGTGGDNPQRCEHCHGRGSVSMYNRQGIHLQVDCSACGGRGIKYDRICYTCGGRKVLKKVMSVTVKISEDK